MEKEIRITGTGHCSIAPDAVSVRYSIVSRNSDYKEAVKLAKSRQQKATKALVAAGIPKNDITTSDFSVSSEKKEIEKYGVRKYIFDCYAVHHSFEVVFDLNMNLLEKVISGIAASCSDPNLSIRFFVKDAGKVRSMLLASAAKDAHSSAKVLCDSLGVKLGELISINYSWSEFDIYSKTSYRACEEISDACSTPEIKPSDINLSDTATFVWAIGEKTNSK